jgi:preprotein translocase subunit SecD
MQKLFLVFFAFVLSTSSAFCADPAVKQAVEDAKKQYPPGDYPPANALKDSTHVKSSDAPRFEIHAVAASGENNRSYIYRKPDGKNEALFLMPEVLLDAPSIKSARADHNGKGEPAVRIALTQAGAQKFGELTEKLVNKRIGIIVSGQVVSAPVIRTAIYGGELIVTVPTDKEAAEMAAKLNP